MTSYIDRISGTIPNTHTDIEIKLYGKNLLITGSNGTGKTCLLTELYQRLDKRIRQKQHNREEEVYNELMRLEKALPSLKKGTQQYNRVLASIKSFHRELADLESAVLIEIADPLDFADRLDERTAILLYLTADRKAEIAQTSSATGVDTQKENARSLARHAQHSATLEQHLVNMRTRIALGKENGDKDIVAEKLELWFEDFIEKLRILFEDETTDLTFDKNHLSFSISQNGKPDFTFQNLSSGYQSIFKIYLELLLHSEYFEIAPGELSGVVFIDEIDVHLHVSLQRLILPFLTTSFPNVQFIVTTHSPFVIMSMQNAVIYDLSSKELISEDLSLYSYSAILQGLLQVPSISNRLVDLVEELTSILNSESIDFERLKEVTSILKSAESNLDKRSRAFLLKGENALLDSEG
ncbi:AAA family ATPase [Pseudovibrio sp. Alg231-02]|uniref:AAA family ATPase n=1 Tax=Pseudovibrio sp. Alg231-02 TaxID=1922223 RepID=UPI00131F1162|nr:AAA family ATPase [Pseudovibrio sp. Alg231-02]